MYFKLSYNHLFPDHIELYYLVALNYTTRLLAQKIFEYRSNGTRAVIVLKRIESDLLSIFAY